MAYYTLKTYNQLTEVEKIRIKYRPFFYTTKTIKGVVYYQIFDDDFYNKL